MSAIDRLAEIEARAAHDPDRSNLDRILGNVRLRVEDVPALVAALRAVLDVHSGCGYGCGTCHKCGEKTPCVTVRAIDAALGGAS